MFNQKHISNSLESIELEKEVISFLISKGVSSVDISKALGFSIHRVEDIKISLNKDKKFKFTERQVFVLEFFKNKTKSKRYISQKEVIDAYGKEFKTAKRSGSARRCITKFYNIGILEKNKDEKYRINTNSLNLNNYDVKISA